MDTNIWLTKNYCHGIMVLLLWYFKAKSFTACFIEFFSVNSNLFHSQAVAARTLFQQNDLNIIERLRTPVRQDFHMGYGMLSLWFNEPWVIVHWITMKTCQIPYENACRTGVRNLSIYSWGTWRSFNRVCSNFNHLQYFPSWYTFQNWITT